MDARNAVIEQPRASGGAIDHVKRYHAGSERSKDKLRQLRFDPIERLVDEYHDINRLIKEEEDYRDERKVRLHPESGKAVLWRPDMLLKLMEERSKISDRLLRYGYGRVPEVNVNVDQAPPPFIVQTTRKGEVYHTGVADIDMDEVEDLGAGL